MQVIRATLNTLKLNFTKRNSFVKPRGDQRTYSNYKYTLDW